jgi:hypothetical protein
MKILSAVRCWPIPDLTVQTVADAVGLSVRYANNILASQESSIGRLVLTEGLSAANAPRGSGSNNQTVSEVAFELRLFGPHPFRKVVQEGLWVSPSEYQAVTVVVCGTALITKHPITPSITRRVHRRTALGNSMVSNPTPARNTRSYC